MPMTRPARPSVCEAHQHAGVGRAGHGADDDVVEPQSEFLLLRPHLLGEADIAEPAQPVDRGAGRDRIGLAAPCLHVLDRALPALADADVEALVDQLDLRAQDAAHQDVAHPVVDRVLERHPALLHQAALHAELGGDRSDLPRVVRLHAADGDEGVGVRCDGVGNDVFELAHLVAAEGEAGVAVLALGVELDRGAEMLGEALQLARWATGRRSADSARISPAFVSLVPVRGGPPIPTQPPPPRPPPGLCRAVWQGVCRALENESARTTIVKRRSGAVELRDRRRI